MLEKIIGTKDKGISMAARLALAFAFKPYGELQSLTLDSSEKNLAFTVMLKGEQTPLEVNIEQYDLVYDGDENFLTAKEIKTSREWLTLLAEQCLSNKKIPIPGKLAMALRVIA